MEVILLEKVHKLGALGDKVSVKPGYGRNFLIPSGKAVPATKDNLAEFEARRAELEKQQQEKLAAATSRAEKINGLAVEIAKKAGDEGKLFGSVGTVDIVEALAAKDIEISKNEVRLPEGPIRSLGEQEITIDLHTDVQATLALNVIEDESE